jgi:heptosyltransferase-2
MQIKKILLRGPNWVGDSVLAIPAMKAVRATFPDAEITLLVRPWVAGLFTAACFVDRVWNEPRPASISQWSRLTREIRDGQFDLAILFPNSFESALMMFLAAVPMRVGYATDGRRLLLTNTVSPRHDGRHLAHYYLDLIKNTVITAANVDASMPSIEIVTTKEEKAEARRLLAAEGIANNEKFLVLNPGAAYGSAKRWSEERFAAAADRLGQYLDLRVAIIGSAAELPVAEKIRSKMKSMPAVLTGKTTLETLMGVLSESSLMVTNDSGPMHIAAALGVPTIAVFGSTDDRATGPIGPKTRIVKHPVDCSPCLLRQCPIDHRCMSGISVEDVCEAAQELVRHG